jgi:hypothetical protein
VRSSEGALRVLAALHLQTLGYAVLYAAAKPVEPVEVKKGFLSHMVTLSLNYRGLQGPGKPAQVTAEMVAGVNIIVSGAGDVAANGTYLPGEAMNGKPAFYKSGTNWFMGWETGFPDKWVIRDGSGNYPYVSSQDVASPELVTAWDVIGLSSPAPDVVLDPFLLSLACSTDGAAIRYTTDGDYPDATNGTLYTAPIALPEAGTVVRAAAYKTGLNPGDCTEIIVQP